jgi:hypothetical protein
MKSEINQRSYNMTESDKFRRGILKAIEITGVVASVASVNAGHNRNQVARFLSGANDIKLATLGDICTKGFGMPLDTVYRMGK